MDAPAHGRRITIWLSAESYAFVEKLIDAGFAESHDGLIQIALEALGNEIETSARNAALEEGCPNAEYASLEELADMLDQSEQRQDNQKH
jgi:hypothetical protein